MKKVTAVEWLQEFMNNGKQKSEGIISAAFAKAKQMEKEQITDAYIDGSLTGCGCYDYMEKEDAEQYYNDTYKNSQGDIEDEWLSRGY